MNANLEEILDSPINCLPPELLVRIFLLSEEGQSQRYPHLRYLGVCRYWREIVKGAAVLWTIIKFSPWKGKEFVQEFVYRSRSAKLSVFSPYNYDLHGRERIDEVVPVFNELLERESYRIKFLYITEDRDRDIPTLLSGKILSAINTFIYHEYPLFQAGKRPTLPLAILNSSDNIRYLHVPLFANSLLSEVQASFHRLKTLNVKVTSVPVATQFLTHLPLCCNLESLAVLKSNDESINWNEFHFPFTITLSNLLSLWTNHWNFIDQLSTPALRRLIVHQPSKLFQLNHTFLEHYNLLPETHLNISLHDVVSNSPTICINGSTCVENPLVGMMMYQDIDIQEKVLLPSISPSEPTSFHVSEPAIGLGSALLPNLLSKLHNLEVLGIYCMRPDYLYKRGRFTIEATRIMKIFTKRIFDELRSAKTRSLSIAIPGNLLRTILGSINACSALSNLETIDFWIIGNPPHYNPNSYGPKWVKFLRLRRKAWYGPLQKLKVHGGVKIDSKWVEEATALGTEISS